GRLARTVMTLGRELIHVLPTQVPLFGNPFGAFALVDELKACAKVGVQFFIAAAHIAEHGYAGHTLYTAGDYIVHIAGSHGLSCEMQGLLARAAHAIERYGRHLTRKS